MRTRTRTLNTSLPACVYEYHRLSVPPVTTPIVTNYSIRTYPSLNETMVDELAGGRRSGSCSHQKVATTVFSHPVSWQHPHWGYYQLQPPSWPIYTHVYTGSALFERYGSYLFNTVFGNPTITVPSAYDWKTLSYYAFDAMRPTLNKEGLLLNNLVIETVRAVKTAHSRWTKPNTKIPKAPTGWKDILMSRLRRIAGFNLLYQFAIRPTVQDVMTIHTRLRELEEVIASLIREGDKIQVRHYKAPIIDRITLPSDYVYQDTVLSADHVGHKTVVETRWQTRPTYHATMRFRYETQYLKSLIGSLRAKLDAFGVSRVASTLWEAIPYSFIIDWFVDVGGFIRSIEDSLAGDLMPMQMLTFDHSIKYEYRTTCYLDIGRLHPWRFIHRLPLYQKATSYYVRRAEAPSLYDVLSVRLPSVNQTLLGGSLLLTRRNTTRKGRNVKK